MLPSQARVPHADNPMMQTLEPTAAAAVPDGWLVMSACFLTAVVAGILAIWRRSHRPGGYLHKLIIPPPDVEYAIDGAPTLVPTATESVRHNRGISDPRKCTGSNKRAASSGGHANDVSSAKKNSREEGKLGSSGRRAPKPKASARTVDRMMDADAEEQTKTQKKKKGTGKKARLAPHT